MRRWWWLISGSLLLVHCGEGSETTGQGSGGGMTASGSATGGSDVVSSAGSGGMGGMGQPPFQLEVHTELDGDGTLVMRTNLPHDLPGCRLLNDAPCVDDDNDGLTDAWEELAILRLRPFVRLDEQEMLVDDPTSVTGMAARVTLVDGFVHVYMMLGYARDYGTCGGFTAHNGDSERVALQLEWLDEGAGDVRVHKAYTAAHEGTLNDHGRVFEGAELATLVHEPDLAFADEPRWVVFASANKHATYATVDICENISVLPCADEDCAPDGVADPSPYTLRMPFVNAGEPSAPLETDLAVIGFAGEEAWVDQPFCGGIGGNGCSSAVVDKLTQSPF